MNLTLNAFAITLIIAVCIYFLLDKVIDLAVKDPNANQMFKIILLIFCVVFAFFGQAVIRL